MVAIALRLRPDCVTLVPEKRQELTTEGGLDVLGQSAHLRPRIAALQAVGIVVSLFVDPVRGQIEAASQVGANFIEIHTGSYCEARDAESRALELEKIAEAIRVGQQCGLGVNAGHGLNYRNIAPVVALGGIEEYNIGHSIVSRAVLVGMERAVREMVELIR
jgi:pyridoxine 5-phosphate synthase